MVKINKSSVIRKVFAIKLFFVAIVYCLIAIMAGDWNVMEWGIVVRILFAVAAWIFLKGKIDYKGDAKDIFYSQKDLEESFSAGVDRGISTAEGYDSDSTPTFPEWLEVKHLTLK